MPLLGEIGGLMGLLLGASVLTIIELLDLLIYKLIFKGIYGIQLWDGQMK